MLFVAAKLGPVEEALDNEHAPLAVPAQAPLPTSLEQFLAGIDGRAFRFAELGLRHR
jgi:RNA polymerase sigma-70 factor (ECF subfamily)